MAKLVKIEAPFRSMDVPAANGAAAGIPGEVIAAISAAVACMCGAGATVVGIRPAKRERSGRSAWSTAGLLDVTRAF